MPRPLGFLCANALGPCHRRALRSHDNLLPASVMYATRKLQASKLLIMHIHTTTPIAEVEPLNSSSSIPKPSLYTPWNELGPLVGGNGRAKLVWESILAGCDPLIDTQRVTAPTRRKLLEYNMSIGAKVIKCVVADDRTTKLLIQFDSDGSTVETVIIPHFQPRRTSVNMEASDQRSSLCVSTQVGCNRKCVFCATGTMGLIRNLTAEEIAAQVHLAMMTIAQTQLPPLTRLVFMGEGDAGCNLREVRRCIETMLTSRYAFDIGRTQMTLSSVGPSPASIAKMATIPVPLAWSLHTADNELRKKLVPTVTHTVEELRDAYAQGLGTREGGKHLRVFRVGVTMLRGINDAPHHAAQIAELLAPMKEQHKLLVCVDLIPYNKVNLPYPQFVGLEGSDLETMSAFQKVIRDRGLACFVRMPRGADKNAACGQLVSTSLL